MFMMIVVPRAVVPRAGVMCGALGGREFPSLKNMHGYRFLGFRCLFCFVLGFLVSKIYQIPISCSQVDIDPIFQMFKILLDGSSGFFGDRLFEKCQHFGFTKIREL